MRLLLTFKTSNSRLPYDYRRVILSFFKRALSEIADGRFFQEFYMKPERRKFVFSVGLPKCSFNNGEITFEKNQFRVTFSTGDSRTGFVFMSAFISQKGKKFPAPLENSFILEAITQLPERSVVSNSALIKMGSPLCLREHNIENKKDFYYSVNNPLFGCKSYEVICNQLKLAGFNEKLISDFSITPINTKKTVVTHYDCKIECSLGEFMIYADKSIINYFLRYGIGSRVSAGFGYCELIAEGEMEVKDEV